MRLHQKVGDGREVHVPRGELHMAQVGGGQVLQGHLALHIQAASNVQIGVLDHPREVLFNILSFLNPLDPCSILSNNLFCKDRTPIPSKTNKGFFCERKGEKDHIT